MISCPFFNHQCRFQVRAQHAKIRHYSIINVALMIIVFISKSVEVSGEESSLLLSCSSFTSCDTCSRSSPLCRWCTKPGDEGNFSCNLIGSLWFGCISSNPCEESRNEYPKEICKRSQPEKLGISLELKRTLLMTSSIWLLVTCLILCISSSHRIKQEKNLRKQKQEICVESFVETNYQSISTNEYKQNTNDGNIHESTYLGNEVKIPNKDSEKPIINHKISYLKIVYQSSITCIAVLMVIAYFPKPPKLNVCTSQVDWLSLFESIVSNFDNDNNGEKKSFFEVESNILMSIYNPNLYDLHLDSVQSWFRYEGILFCSFSIFPATIAATSVTDDTVSLKLQPENFQVLYDLLLDYYNKGELEIEVKVNSRVTIPSFFHASFAVSFDHLNIHVSKDEIKDNFAYQEKELCLCK